MTHRIFRTLITTTCLAALLASAPAPAQDAVPIPPMPPMPEMPKLPDAPMPPEDASSTVPPAPEGFEEEAEDAGITLDDAESAALLKEIEGTADESADVVPEVDQDSGVPADAPVDVPPPTATPEISPEEMLQPEEAAPSAPAASEDPAIREETPAEPAMSEVPEAPIVPAMEADVPPPPILPKETSDTGEDIITMSQEERDAEVKALLDDLDADESDDGMQMPKRRAIEDTRVPPFLFNKQQNDDNKHLYPVYTGADLDALLMKESREGNLNAVQALLIKGRSANYQDAVTGDTPLIEAVRTGQKHMVRLLLLRGADANLSNKQGQTPLHFAAAQGDIAIMQALLDAQADPNVPDDKTATPLQVAAAAGQPEAVRLLTLWGGEEPAASPVIPQEDVIILTQDETGKAEWKAPKAVSDEEGDAPADGNLVVGKWYREKGSWKNIWFKYQAARPNKGEHAYAQEGWRYSQDKDGKWYVYDGEHVTYAALSEEEKKRWNSLLNGWIDANARFEKLTQQQKIEWNEKRKMLQLVFPSHFSSPTADGQAYLAGVLEKWDTLNVPVPATVVPMEVAEVVPPTPELQAALEMPVSMRTPEQRAAAYATEQSAPTAPMAPQPVPEQPLAPVAQPDAAAQVPASMQQPDAAPALQPETPAAPAITPLEAGAIIAAKQAQEDNLRAVQAVAPTSALTKKINDQAALSGATVTPDTQKQLEVLQMLGEWETVDEARSTLQPAQRAEAEVSRQVLAQKVAPGGSHADAFVSLPPKLKTQFAESMATWDKAGATQTKLPDYYSKEYANATPVDMPVKAAIAAEGVDTPKSLLWAQEHPDITPYWRKNEFGETEIVAVYELKMVAEDSTAPRVTEIPINLPQPQALPPVPLPKVQDVEGLQPLDPATATPEQIEEMIRATQSLKKVIAALESLRGLLAE